MEAFETTHKLSFETAPSITSLLMGAEHTLFRIGTVGGLWGSLPDCYYILSFLNSSPHNGHLNDVFEWFEHSCKRDNVNLLVLETMNGRFYNHLIQKRGFIELDKKHKNCIKVFSEPLYHKLLENGNEILKKGSLECI